MWTSAATSTATGGIDLIESALGVQVILCDGMRGDTGVLKSGGRDVVDRQEGLEK